jgi:hypothetical protein
VALSHVVVLDKKDRDKYCDMVATKMIPAQIVEAQKLAREWNDGSFWKKAKT